MTANAGNIKLVSQLYNFESVVNKQKIPIRILDRWCQISLCQIPLYCILHGWNVAAKDC